jgi:hypothetical protein
MAQILIPSGTTVNETQNLDSANALLEVFGVLNVDGEDDAGTAVNVTGTNARILNAGTIDGSFNGIDFENGGISSGKIINRGTITSESRAVNLGGKNVELENNSEIVTTASPRNGVIYADRTAKSFFITNRDLIDVGEGNDGDAVSLELGTNVNSSIINRGLIQGRGVAGVVGEENQSSAVRFYTEEDSGSLFNGFLSNSGTLAAENGAAVVIEDGVEFNGSIFNNGQILSQNAENGVGLNLEDGSQLIGAIFNNGTINGGLTGVNFDNGGRVTGTLLNNGLITSTSRAVNFGGNKTTVINRGQTIVSETPRNGVIYGDQTALNFAIANKSKGTIDVGEGNDGDAVSLELGAQVQGSVTNQGLIQGRGLPAGEANNENNQASAIRLYWGSDSGVSTSVFQGNIENAGTLATENGAAVLVEDKVQLKGKIINQGTIEGGANNGGQLAVDVSQGEGNFNLSNSGTINGDILLSAGDDLYDGRGGIVNGVISGGSGNDTLIGGSGVETLLGGEGEDTFLFGDEPFSDTESVTADNGIQVFNDPDRLQDYQVREDLLVFEASNLDVDRFEFQNDLSSNLTGESNLLVLQDDFENAAAAAEAIANNDSITSDRGLFVYFNTTLGFSRVVASEDLSDGGTISVLANLENQTDVGNLVKFTAEDFALI